MITFKQLFYEGNTFPSELYHATSVNSLSQIIKTDSIKLTFATPDGADSAVNKDKFFYFSMSYDKFGRYARSTPNQKLETNVSFADVTLVMDAHKMQQRGKLIDVDYWGHAKYSDNEREVRFVSDKQKLHPINNYIKEIHVYVRQSDPKRHNHKVEYHQLYIRKLLQIEDYKNVPIFFYNNKKAFKLHLKAKAVPLREAISPNMKYTPNLYPYRSRSTYPGRKDLFVISLEALINMFNDVDPKEVSNEEVREQMDRYNNMLHMYQRDFKPSVGADLHNARRDNPEEFQEFTNLMRKNKLRTLDDLHTHLKKTYKNGL